MDLLTSDKGIVPTAVGIIDGVDEFRCVPLRRFVELVGDHRR